MGQRRELVTTVLVLKEIEAGRLELDREAAAYMPELAGIAGDVTLRHLLGHTSGIPDFGALGPLENRSGAIDRHKLLQDALAVDTDFDAGMGWSYSNTGFLLLQEILEAASGKSYAELVRLHIAHPLRLASFEALDENLPRDVLLPDLGDPRPASEYPPNIGGAANVVATSTEMARFWHAAMAGQLVDHRLINDALRTLNPVFGSEQMMMGEGIMLIAPSDGSGHWIGHTGGARQVDALLLYSPKRQMILAIAGIGPDTRAMEAAGALIDALGRCEIGRC